MNILFVNPPLYTFYNFHNTHQYPMYMYSLATRYKLMGHNVRIVDMHPELAFNPSVRSTNGSMMYDGDPLISDTGISKECGNFSSEKLVKPLIRSGLSQDVLTQELNSNKFDQIIICDMGSKSDISSSSIYYSHLGISEVVDVIGASRYNGEILVSGKYSKIFKDQGGFKKFYDEDCDLLNTDLSLIPYKPRRIGLSTSMGCQNNCFFCFVRSLEGSEIKRNSVDRIMSSLDYIVSMGYKKIRLMDSDVLSGWDIHMKEVFNQIIAKNYGLSVSSYGGYEPSKVTEEIMEKSKAIGFSEMVLPLDNCDSSTLSFWGGAKSVDAWKNSVTIAKKYFKNISSYIMIGYPGQTKENAIQSISMCLDAGVSPLLLLFTPLDGTGYEDNNIPADKKHPLLFPYAWDKFTVFDMEYLLEKYNTWYKKTTVKVSDGPNVYHTTGGPIPINGDNNG